MGWAAQNPPANPLFHLPHTSYGEQLLNTDAASLLHNKPQHVYTALNGGCICKYTNQPTNQPQCNHSTIILLGIYSMNEQTHNLNMHLCFSISSIHMQTLLYFFPSRTFTDIIHSPDLDHHNKTPCSNRTHSLLIQQWPFSVKVCAWNCISNSFPMPLSVQWQHFACVFMKKVLCSLYAFHQTTKQFDNHQLWPFTKINITCDPRPQLTHSKAGPPTETGCFRGGAFVMLIIWPNPNDPDICCPTCVKPHIQFVSEILKAGMTLEAVNCVCVHLLHVCVCVCVSIDFFKLYASSTAVITSRTLMHASMCSTCF